MEEIITTKYLEYMPIPPTEMKLNQNLKQIEGYNQLLFYY